MSLKKSVVGFAKSATVLAILTGSVATVTSMVLAPAAVAADKKQQLTSKMKPLGEAQKLMQEKKYKEALAVITSQVDPIQGKNEYETQVTNDMRLYCLRMSNDFPGLIKALEAMLQANQVPAGEIAARQEDIADSAFIAKDYAKVIQYAELILKGQPSNTKMIDMVARSYYLKEDYKSSAENFTKLLKYKEDKDTYAYLMSAYAKMDNKAGVVSTLEKKLAKFPAQEDWKNMFKYMKGEASYSEREQIEIYRLQKTMGILSADDHIGLAELAMAMTDPGDAKAALEAGIGAGVIKADERTNKLLNLAKSQAAADLGSLDAVAKEAANKPDGSALAKVGLAYLGHGQYDKAASALQTALTKGGLKSVDEVQIQLGAAQYFAKKPADAKKAFAAVSDKSKVARLARLWTIYMDQK